MCTFCDRSATARALPFADLVDALEEAALEYAAGAIVCPVRQAVPLQGQGVLLSMPASARDVAIHKLVSVQPANVSAGIPTLHGLVTVCDARTGRPLCLLDGPEVTGRRTAAVSLLGIRTFLRRPLETALLIGTGVQARYHVQGLHALYPACRIWIRGRTREDGARFCAQNADLHPHLLACQDPIPADAQVVIALTTSKQAVYDEPGKPDRLVIGVGAFTPDMVEIGPKTLHSSSVYVDDPVAARSEAGDLLSANVEWESVLPLASAIGNPAPAGPVVLKSVGTAAWDLAAGRVAARQLGLLAREPK